MTTDTPALPAPLVSAEVDLRDFAYLPLDVLRLRDSDLACVEDAEVFRCAVLSWCVAWHQVPAASLPDDDTLLARLLGFGRDVKGWKRIRAAGGLRGWIACSDGRLYHAVVAEKARDAWAAKQSQRSRTEAARKAREAARQSQSHGLQQSLSQTHETSVTETVTASKGEGREGKGIRNTSLLSQAPALPPEDRPPADGPQLALVDPPPATKPSGPPDCPHQAVLALWAEVLPAMPQHLPSQWRGARADHLRARWRETAVEKGWTTEAQGLTYLRKLFAHVGRSEFLTGRVQSRDPSKRPFVIELEWLVNPTNWAKVIEGKYHQEAA